MVAEVSDGRHRGRGECVPYARYRETVAGVTAALEAMRQQLARGLDREALQRRCRPAPRATRSTARSGISRRRRAASRPIELAGLPAPQPLVTAYTISLGTPEAMAEAAAQGGRAQAPEGQARRGRRSGAHRGGARGRAQCRADRRRQRRWRADNLARQLRGLRRGRRHPGRAAAAGRRRRGARARSRGRFRSAPTRACTTAPRCRARRQIRRGQHQARQDRRPDRGAGDGAGGRAARLLASWSAAWWRRRSRWRPRSCSRSARASSISTGRCCWRATARTGCATTAAWFIRRRRRCG